MFVLGVIIIGFMLLHLYNFWFKMQFIEINPAVDGQRHDRHDVAPLRFVPAQADRMAPRTPDDDAVFRRVVKDGVPRLLYSGLAAVVDVAEPPVAFGCGCRDFGFWRQFHLWHWRAARAELSGHKVMQSL